MKHEIIRWQWHQLDHMPVICTSLQTDNHASISSLNFYRPDALPDAQPRVVINTAVKRHAFDNCMKKKHIRMSSVFLFSFRKVCYRMQWTAQGSVCIPPCDFLSDYTVIWGIIVCSFVCFFCLYGHGFLSGDKRSGRSGREILHACSTAIRTGLLPFGELWLSESHGGCITSGMSICTVHLGPSVQQQRWAFGIGCGGVA